MQTQLYVASTERDNAGQAPRADLMAPIDNAGAHWNGKPYGGLWTSTRIAPGYSEWIEWCGEEMPHWIGDAWVLEVDPAARVLHVTDKSDLEGLPTLISTSYEHRALLDYEQIATQYDAIHFADSGCAWSYCRYIDCESTLWFRWRFTSARLDMTATQIKAQYDAIRAPRAADEDREFAAALDQILATS